MKKQWANFWADQDYWLLGAVAVLVTLGFLMVASASTDFAAYKYNNTYHFMIRHFVYLVVALFGLIIAALLPVSAYYRNAFALFGLGLALLVAVLIIGTNVNGSQRWIRFGPFGLQPSEFMKIAMVIVTARYITKFQGDLKQKKLYFVRPLVMFFVTAILLLLEPDYGATVLIGFTVVGMLFLSGVPMISFATLMGSGLMLVSYLATSSEYRMKRLTGYQNPWEHQFDSGYQLTQSLIAFGRGHWEGVGFGNSVQKLMFLPEAHTDFVFAIWAEEMGFIGAAFIVGLFVLLVSRIIRLSRRAAARNQPFVAWVAMGLALLISGQAFINMGVASGLLPTKGLTLPFISYGGSSLLQSFMMVGLLMRLQVSVNHSATRTKSKRDAGEEYA